MDELEVMDTELSEEMQEVADPDYDEVDETSEEESVETQEVAEPEEQSREQNAAYANMRRRAEAEAQRKMDKSIAELCKDVVHPITGLPITTFDEYRDAIAAQNRLQAEAKLKENGVDVSILDDYVKTSPVLMEARQIVEQNKMAQAEAQLNADFEELKLLNSDLQTFEDLQNDPNFGLIIQRIEQGASLVDAYKLVNFDLLMNKEAKGAKQAAINQARGKAHLEPTETLNESTDSAISESLLAELRSNFPDKSEKEIRKLYKQTFK